MLTIIFLVIGTSLVFSSGFVLGILWTLGRVHYIRIEEVEED